jgi:hypothetical protein
LPYLVPCFSRLLFILAARFLATLKKGRRLGATSTITLVFVSEHTSASEWVDWEIRESHRLGKGVIAMYQGESPPAVLPRALGELGVNPIQWTHEGLNRAIATAAAKPQP